MITFIEALNKAKNYLAEYDIPVEITVIDRFSEGWLFCFQSREFLENNDFSAQLIGNCPFILDKDSGKIYELGAAYPIDVCIQKYENKKDKSEFFN